MDLFDLSSALFGRKGMDSDSVEYEETTRTYVGTATSDSADGSVYVELSEDVTMPDEYEGEHGMGVEMPTVPRVSEGDEVLVTVFGSGAMKSPVVTGNAGEGDRQNAAIAAAHAIANAAQAVAEAVNQHFWHDDNGAHVTEATQEEWEQSQSGPNSLWNSLGMLFRDGLNNLLTLTTEDGARALTIWNGLGNAASNVLASFSENGIGLAGDAFRLSSTKVADSPYDGVTSTTSKIHMGDKDSNYSVQSYLDTYIELGHLDGADQDVASGNFHVGFDIEDGEGQLLHNAQLYIGAGVSPTGTYSSDASLSASDVSLMATEIVGISGKHISIIDTESSPSLYCDVSKFISGIMCHSPSSAEEVTIGSDDFAGSNRALSIKAVVSNSSSDVNGHSLDFLIRTDGINLYDYTTAQTLWTFNDSPSQANLTRGSAAASWSNGIVRRYGKVVTMTINGAKLSAALASGSTSGSIATIPTGYRPSVLQRGIACIGTTGNYANVWFVASTTGNVAIANRSSLQIPTTAEISMQITYIID